MLNSLDYSLPERIRSDVENAFDDWRAGGKVTRIWAKDAGVWTNADEAKWLGWLGSVEAELAKASEYAEFAKDAATFDDVLLMGMGGSSLCPEVLSVTFGKTRFHVLDSTVPAQIKTVESKIDLEKTLFIVASKSGSTLEPNTFKQYFFDRVAERIGREKAGSRFVAITDPGSKMQRVAERDGFRKIFFGDPQIGGRFSALSPFGMTAAAAMGLDVSDFLTRAAGMVEACRDENPAANPGAALGTVLGVCERAGIGKLTIFTSPEIYDLGAWLEQLIAESTGKKGVSIIPVDREPVLPAGDYSEDRVIAFLKLKGSDSAAMDEKCDALAAKGHPVVRIELDSIENLGQEFFRWEFATAVAGAVMGINPFDQPDVESAKIEARKITEEYEKTGALPDETPFFEEGGVKLFTSDDYASKLLAFVGDSKSLKRLLNAHLDHLQDGDYFALLAYVEMNAAHEDLLQQIRAKVLSRKLTATCLGFGPRFLHSTGQGYKGGANNGVFLQITSDDAVDFPVPEQKFTFGVVKAAQARGDFQVLIDRERRALRVHLGPDVEAGLKALLELV